MWVPEYIWGHIDYIPCPHCGERAQPDGWNTEPRRVFLEDDVCYLMGFRCVQHLLLMVVCTCRLFRRSLYLPLSPVHYFVVRTMLLCTHPKCPAYLYIFSGLWCLTWSQVRMQVVHEEKRGRGHAGRRAYDSDVQRVGSCGVGQDG